MPGGKDEGFTMTLHHGFLTAVSVSQGGRMNEASSPAGQGGRMIEALWRWHPQATKLKGSHAAAPAPQIRLAAVPVALALIPAYVPRVAINIGAVTVYVAIFAAQLGALMRGGPIVAPIQIAAQLPAVMRDLGFVAAYVAYIGAPVSVVTTQITVTMVVAVLRHHAACARKNQKHQPYQSAFY